MDLGASVVKSHEEIRTHLLATEARVLREYGYPKATVESVIADKIHSAFFREHLKEARENAVQVNAHAVIVIDKLLEEIAAAHPVKKVSKRAMR